MHIYFEEKYQELANKHEFTMREKMTLKVEKERLLVKLSASEKGRETLQQMLKKDGSLSQMGFDNSMNNIQIKTNKKGVLNRKKKGDVNKENSIFGSQRLNPKSKSNPVLTPIPDPMPNKYVNPQTGLAIDVKSTFNSNPSHIKKIQVIYELNINICWS